MVAKSKATVDYPREMRLLKAAHAREIKALQDDHGYTCRRHVEKQESLKSELEGFKLAADTLKAENMRLCDRITRLEPAEREVYRLSGVLDGLVRAGKIEPLPVDDYVHFTPNAIHPDTYTRR